MRLLKQLITGERYKTERMRNRFYFSILSWVQVCYASKTTVKAEPSHEGVGLHLA